MFAVPRHQSSRVKAMFGARVVIAKDEVLLGRSQSSLVSQRWLIGLSPSATDNQIAIKLIINDHEAFQGGFAIAIGKPTNVIPTPLEPFVLFMSNGFLGVAPWFDAEDISQFIQRWSNKFVTIERKRIDLEMHGMGVHLEFIGRTAATPNENKMSDGGRERASPGVKVWKSSQM
jgi:hypothetical protein